MNRDYDRDDVAQDYENIRPDYPEDMRKVVLDCLERNSVDKERKRFLLDVGCGGGKSTELLSADFDKILGIDISAAQIEIAKKKMKNSEHVQFQVVHDNLFPVEDGTVDVVLCASALHYLDLPTFLAECDRVLVDGGIVAVTSYIPRTMRSLNGTIIGNLADESCEYRPAYIDFLTVCGMDESSKNHCMDFYKSIYNSIENPTKRWEAEITIELKWTVKKYLQMMETVAGYKEKRYRAQSFSDDPLDVLSTAMSKVFQKKGLEYALDSEMIVSYYMPVIVIDKKDGHKIQ